MKKRALLIIAALALIAVPAAAQNYVPPADAIVLDMSISDGTNLNPIGTLYCVAAD